MKRAQEIQNGNLIIVKKNKKKRIIKAKILINREKSFFVIL